MQDLVHCCSGSEEGDTDRLVMLAIYDCGKRHPIHSTRKLIDHHRRLLTPPMARSPTTTTAVLFFMHSSRAGGLARGGADLANLTAAGGVRGVPTMRPPSSISSLRDSVSVYPSPGAEPAEGQQGLQPPRHAG